jgi:MoxR-like ATPase
MTVEASPRPAAPLPTPGSVQQFAQAFAAIRSEVSRVLLGQDDVVEQVLLAIFARGHVLIEGVPGLGKTLLVRTLGRVLGSEFKRIQFTPDLMPSDVTGGNVFNQQQDAFVFLPGPVFTQLLLADEINRAPAKTQSSLLEAMQDRSVTVDGITRPLPQPFFTIATQNPIESQGTYPLPEAQLDRFLLKIDVGHPSREVEKSILTNYLRGFDPADLDTLGVRQVCTAKELLGLAAVAQTVAVDDGILDYIADITGRTRVQRSIYLGASPRASIALLTTARVCAASDGRSFVIPDDVKRLAPAVLRHRLVLHPDAEIEGMTTDDCVQSILREAPVPKTAA